MPYVGRAPSAVPVTADDIPANSIDASKIVDGAIAVADVADNAITEAKIADAAVVSLKSGRKNLIINGGFDVWQRGTSFSGVSSGTYHADRWNIWSNGGTIDIDKVSGGLQFAISGTGVTNSLMQDIEAQDVPLGDYILSFDADNYSNILSANCYSIGGGTHYGNLTYISDGKYSMTLTSANFNSSTTAIRVEIYLNANTTIVINNVQLELGSVATDFEHRSYGEELALCQRYFVGYDYNGTGAHGYVCIFAGYDADDAMGVLNLPVPMRTSPTLTYSGVFMRYAGASSEVDGGTVVAYNYGDNRSVFALNYDNSTNAFSGHQGGAMFWGVSGDSTANYIRLDAEL